MDDPSEVTPERSESAPLEAPAPPPKRSAAPSLVINIYTWATPIVGVVMLVIGLLGGYAGRPLIAPSPTPTATSVPATPVAAAPPAAAQPTPDPEILKQVMASLIPEVRHFKGDPKAPVTIIEFSDFQ
jgi:hypothetical protein